MLQAPPSRPYLSPGQLYHAQATADRRSSGDHQQQPSSSSSLLDNIRDIFPAYDSRRQTTVPRLHQKFYPLQDPYADRRPLFSAPVNRPIEELAWYEDTLIWSKGASVFRTCSYAHEKQQIQHACFAWFEGGDDDREKEEGDGKAATRRSARQPFPNTFGPFATSYTAGDVAPSSQSSSSSSSNKSGRCLVVFLESIAHVYLASGEDRVIHLPFAVEKVFNLEAPAKGLVLQRKLSASEEQSVHGSAGESSSTRMQGGARQHRLYAMLDPEKEMTPLAFASSSQLTASKIESGQLQAFPLLLELVAWTGPLAILWDKISNELVFCQWSRNKARRRSLNTQIATSPDEDARKRRRRSSLSPRPATAADQVSGAAGPSRPSRTSVGGGGRRKSSVGGHRSLAGRSNEAESSKAEGDDALRAALDLDGSGTNVDRLDRPGGGPHRRLSDRPTARSQRRTSGMMVDPSAAGLLPRAAPRLLNEISEMDLRETTMLMGLEIGGTEEDLGEESEMVLTQIRRWQVPVQAT